MNDFELGIKPKRNIPFDREYVKEHREEIIYELVCEYLGEHAGMQDNLTLWTAFKNKNKVKVIDTGEEVYIHSIKSYIEWENKEVHTRYVICKSQDKDEFKTEYTNGLRVCQEGDLECICFVVSTENYGF